MNLLVAHGAVDHMRMYSCSKEYNKLHLHSFSAEGFNSVKRNNLLYGVHVLYYLLLLVQVEGRQAHVLTPTPPSGR
jgi:hypothetical protein